MANYNIKPDLVLIELQKGGCRSSSIKQCFVIVLRLNQQRSRFCKIDLLIRLCLYINTVSISSDGYFAAGILAVKPCYLLSDSSCFNSGIYQ
jgi:hypothetical protein